MKIYLARHGQSRWQVERGADDWNSPLTAVGQQQARCLGDWLAQTPQLDVQSHPLTIGALYASSYLRAQETATAVAQALHLPLHTDDNLREADFLVSAQLPQAKSVTSGWIDWEATAVYTDLKQRAQTALHTLTAVAENNNGTVLAISHGGFISTLLRVAFGTDTTSFWIYNTSLTLIEWKRGRWHLVFFNLWDHLPTNLRTY